jgi:hypothetical protein
MDEADRTSNTIPANTQMLKEYFENRGMTPLRDFHLDDIVEGSLTYESPTID